VVVIAVVMVVCAGSGSGGSNGDCGGCLFVFFFQPKNGTWYRKEIKKTIILTEILVLR
jgi:hypothetical protein